MLPAQQTQTYSQCCNVQRSDELLIFGVDVGAVQQQQVHNSHEAVEARHVQCRLLRQAALVHRVTLLEKREQQLRVTRRCNVEQRCLLHCV